MESRALLSATTPLNSAVSAEVATVVTKASFEYPIVAGQWHVTGQDIEGDVTMTQTKNKVQSDITIMGISVHMKSKFTKKSPDELFGTTKVTNPLGDGKLKVGVHIHFLTATTFSGEVDVPALGMSIAINGTKTPIMVRQQPIASARITAPMPDFQKMNASYEVHVSQTYVEFDGVDHSKFVEMTLHTDRDV